MSLHDRLTNHSQNRFGRALRAAAVLLVVFLGCAETPIAVPPGTLPELDQNSYVHQMEVLAHHFPGANRPGKMQMMAIGERRYLFQLAFPGETWDFLLLWLWSW